MGTKMVYVKRSLAVLLFLLLFGWSFSAASDLLMHKQIEGQWNMTAKVKGFYNLPPMSQDVLFFGSSHMYCSIDPAVFREETGLESYIFATPKQPLWITYHYMVEALKTQRPDLMVVEIHMADWDEDYLDEGTNHPALDPIPLSRNKVDMVWASVPPGERRYYLFHLMKYHVRWEELRKEDFERLYEKEVDPERGFVRLTTAAIDIPDEPLPDTTEAVVANPRNTEYLGKMIDLAAQEGIPLVFFKSPSNASEKEKRHYNSVAELAAARGVPFRDYNDPVLYAAIGLDRATDFYDLRHLNETGMRKFVPHVSAWLLEAAAAGPPAGSE